MSTDDDRALSERCNCAHYGSADRCPHHTQKDFEAADAARSGWTLSEREALAATITEAWHRGDSDVDAILAAGWVSPAEVERRVEAARAEGAAEVWTQGYVAGLDNAASWQSGLNVPPTPNPYKSGHDNEEGTDEH